MRYAFMLIGAMASLGLIAVSITMNFRFGQLLGRTEIDGIIYGLASGCADGLKVILPFSIAEAWRHNRLLAVSVSITLFLIFSIYSVTSSLGFSAINRAETNGSRLKATADYTNLKKSHARLVKQRDSLPAFRPVAALKGLLRARQQNHRWQTTSGCTDATVGPSRTFCNEYYQIKAELGVASKAGSLDQKVEGLSRKLQNFTGGLATSGKADPQVQMLHRVSGLSVETVETALTVILTLLVELGSGLGLYAAFGLGKRETQNTDTASEEEPVYPVEDLQQEWLTQRLVQIPNASIAINLLYYDYCNWLLDHRVYPEMTDREFTEWLEQQGYHDTYEFEGCIHYRGITLLD